MEEQFPSDPRSLAWARKDADTSWAEIKTELVAAARVGTLIKDSRSLLLRQALSELALGTSYLERFESGDTHPGVTWSRVEEILASAENIIGQVRNERRMPRQNEY